MIGYRNSRGWSAVILTQDTVPDTRGINLFSDQFDTLDSFLANKYAVFYILEH